MTNPLVRGPWPPLEKEACSGKEGDKRATRQNLSSSLQSLTEKTGKRKKMQRGRNPRERSHLKLGTKARLQILAIVEGIEREATKDIIKKQPNEKER